MIIPDSVTAGQFSQLPLDQVEPHPQNPREDWDIEPLATSLAQYRILTPILVRELRNGAKARWQIIGGHRRWAAAKRNGWSMIAAMVCNATDEQALAPRSAHVACITEWGSGWFLAVVAGR
jgi:ParB/RepB/Spo0J family partition protein